MSCAFGFQGDSARYVCDLEGAFQAGRGKKKNARKRRRRGCRAGARHFSAEERRKKKREEEEAEEEEEEEARESFRPEKDPCSNLVAPDISWIQLSFS